MTRTKLAASALAFALTLSPATAQTPDFASWPPLVENFESTGGGGIMIGGYRPVVSGNSCATPFTATEPGGKVYYNIVEFDAVAIAGGILCTNGRWRAVDGSASGTTPLQVFIKDGFSRRSP